MQDIGAIFGSLETPPSDTLERMQSEEKLSVEIEETTKESSKVGGLKLFILKLLLFIKKLCRFMPSA